jgi:threonine/homoserine/homoserine lactone efflux protein
MESEKLLCYISMGIAALVAIVFLMDAIIGLLGGQSMVLDILFILGAAFVLWQGFETSRELR